MNYLKLTLKFDFVSFVDKDRENKKEKKSVVSLLYALPSVVCVYNKVGRLYILREKGRAEGSEGMCAHSKRQKYEDFQG